MRRNIIAEDRSFRLTRNDWVGVEGVPGVEVRVHRGAIWLTQQDDIRDIVVRPGQSFRLDRKGCAVIEALTDAEISMRIGHGAPHAAPERGNQIIHHTA